MVIGIMRRNNIKRIIQFIVLILFTCCNVFTTKMYIKNISVNEHLKNERIKDICARIDAICSSNYMQLCTVRMLNGRLQFKEFENNCYLFLHNMCVYPGNEWAIKDVGSCKNNNLRRYAKEIERTTRADSDTGVTEVADDLTEAVSGANAEEVTENITEANTAGNIQPITEANTDYNTQIADENAETQVDANSEIKIDNTELTNNTELATDDDVKTTIDERTDENAEFNANETTTAGDTDSTLKLALRTLPRTTYSVDEAPDGHSCPSHCPSVYFPVCVNINRGQGKYYRLLYFVNHCEADRHYCIHWETEYAPPPNEEYELVRAPSNAAWSHCAGNKYMNFATFAESASSLGHYGWLMGDQRASHIMEPYERVPGFG